MPLPCNDGKSPMSSSLSMVIFPSGVIMIEKGIYKPAFVIGVPVGFVNVEAAKELMMETGVPYIVNVGRKGGSNIAAAICNALIYSLVDRG